VLRRFDDPSMPMLAWGAAPKPFQRPVDPSDGLHACTGLRVAALTVMSPPFPDLRLSGVVAGL